MADDDVRPQDPQSIVREATLILKEPVEVMAGPLRTYRKRIQVGLMEPGFFPYFLPPFCLKPQIYI